MILTIALILAMQDATTTCSTYGSQTTCRTNSTSGADAYNRARQSAAEQGARDADTWDRFARDRQAREDRETAQRAADLRRSVGAFLSAGDCPAAISTALHAGDLALANEARTFCTPVTPPN